LSDTLAFDPRYAPPAKVSGLEVDEFKLDSFPQAEDAEPLPDITVDLTPLVVLSDEPPPDPWEEFQVDRKNISELLLLSPSLDSLFKPFDLTSERPMAGFENLTDLEAPRLFDYEDLDTRDQNVVRTMIQAEARSREMIQKARAEGFALTEAARTEAQGLVVEARARAGAEAEVYAKESGGRPRPPSRPPPPKWKSAGARPKVLKTPRKGTGPRPRTDCGRPRIT